MKELDYEEQEEDTVEGDSTLESKVNLFEKASFNLKKMRDEAQLLPDEERKRFAAMVVSTLFPEEGVLDEDDFF